MGTVLAALASIATIMMMQLRIANIRVGFDVGVGEESLETCSEENSVSESASVLKFDGTEEELNTKKFPLEPPGNS